MPTQAKPTSRTFAVHRVQRVATPLPTCKTQVALKRLLGTGVESCCDYTTDCIEKITFHPLLGAAHVAFSQHRPLVLSPDMIWVTIVQGLAQHIKNHAEKLRSRFVGHAGKLTIQVERSDLVQGSPENAWAEVIGDFSTAIRMHLGPTYDDLISDFSTTGPVERTACEVALLDAFQPYFEYRVYCICGIPEITLEGTSDDWQRLRAKVEGLQPYDLDWWLPTLRHICDQLVRASQGDVDLGHWKDIYKRETAYGWDTINGWLVQLLPYLKNHQTGNFTVRNPLLGNPEEQSVSTNCVPGGIAQVPFRLRARSDEVAMEFLGGFVGVTQDAKTLALRPKLGWAVRRASGFEQLLARLGKHQPVPALAGPDFDRCFEKFGLAWRCELPGDLISFFKNCNGIILTGPGGQVVARLRPLEAVAVIEQLVAEGGDDESHTLPDGQVTRMATGPWLRFGDLADGSFVAIELRHTYMKGWRVVRMVPGGAGVCPVIAWSFAEFLEKVLADPDLG